MTREDQGDVERDYEQLTQQWRGQQMSLQSRSQINDDDNDDNNNNRIVVFLVIKPFRYLSLY